MRINYQYSFFLIIAAFLASCENKVKKSITGWWGIDTIYYKGYDIKDCLMINSISFKKDNCSAFPSISKNCMDYFPKGKTTEGEWHIFQSPNVEDSIPLRLRITTENEFFHGNHKVVFYKDDYQKLLKIEIWSDSLYLVCRKLLFNFDKNEELINDLEKLSWKNRPK